MSKFGKIVSSFVIVSILSGCGGRTVPVVKIEKKPPLEINLPTPLVLKDVKFKVVELEGALYAVLSMDEYANLAKNMEELQALLNQYRIIILKQQEYYNN